MPLWRAAARDEGSPTIATDISDRLTLIFSSQNLLGSILPKQNGSPRPPYKEVGSDSLLSTEGRPVESLSALFFVTDGVVTIPGPVATPRAPKGAKQPTLDPEFEYGLGSL